MGELHLVRHGRPLVDTAVPASRWSLHPDAARAIAELRASGALPEAARWFSSPEPKAHETARPLTDSSVTVYDALGEVARPVGWTTSPCGPGAPSPSLTSPPRRAGRRTRQRIARAVRKVRDGFNATDLVLVGHGTAWTLLVAELTGAAPTVADWERLAFPDHCALGGTDARAVLSTWGRWHPAARPTGPGDRW